MLAYISPKKTLAIALVSMSVFISAWAAFLSISQLHHPFSGFFVGPNLVVALGQRAAWPGIQTGLKPLDHVLSVDGVQIDNIDQFNDFVRDAPYGKIIEYTVERDGDLRTFFIPRSLYTWWDLLIVFLAPFMIGFLFIAFGSVLYFKTPSARGRFTFLLLSCGIGLFCTTLFESYSSRIFFRVNLLYPIIGAFSVHLVSLFSDVISLRRRMQKWVYFSYFIAFFLLVSRQFSAFDARLSSIFTYAASIFSLVMIFFTMHVLFQTYQKSLSQTFRDKIKVITIGLILGTTVLTISTFRFLRYGEAFFFDESMLLSSVFPFFMGYAILRKNVFRLDRFIRLTLSYGISATIVLGFYFTFIGAIRSYLPDDKYGSHLNFLMVGIAIGLGLLFNIARLQINNWIQKFVFKGHVKLEESITSMHQVLSKETNLQKASQLLTEYLVESFDVSCGSIFISSPYLPNGFFSFHYKHQPTVDFSIKWPLFINEGLIRYFENRSFPNEIRTIRSKNPGSFLHSLAFFESIQFECLIPLVSSHKVYGFIALGQKHSHDRFDNYDFKILNPLANRLSVWVENSELQFKSTQTSKMATLGNVASMLVHDIKNPLSTIKISAGNLKRKFSNDPETFEMTQFIEEEVDRMNLTLTELLNYAKPHSPSKNKVNVSELMCNLDQKIQARFQRRNMKLVTTLSSTPVYVSGDASRLERALENIFVNALDAGISGQKISCELLCKESHFEIRILDQGCGIKPQDREHIFTPFFSTKKGGTGLGLAIVKQIVEDEHYGSIDLESTDQGTLFVLSFPAFVL